MPDLETLSGWLAHIESMHPRGMAGIELGLDRVRRVKAALGQAESCPVITVGGTNGKGSTCAYLEAILRFAGHRVGCYTSPHLIDFNERIRVDGRPAVDRALCAAFARVEAARQAAGEGGGPVALTYFEFTTLAAWEVFTAAGVEAIVLEVGLGGRLDAVNAYEPDCSVVTGIALDHTDYLGPTRDDIGREKAGIFRAGRPAICADPAPPATLLDHAGTIGTDLRLIGRDFGYTRDPEERAMWRYWQRGADGQLTTRSLGFPGLRGGFQLGNASAALAALDALRDRLPVSMQAIRRGLLEVELPGRFQVLPGRPAVVLDVAHNPQAAAVLADNLGSMGFFAQTFVVVGMLADKDIEATLAALHGRVDHWLVAALDVPRGAGAGRIADAIGSTQVGGSVERFASPADAFAVASKRAGENDRIVVFGSFYTVADVLRSRHGARGA